MERVTRHDTEVAVGDALAAHLEAIEPLASLSDHIREAADLIATALADGGRLLVCGNGGSAADAQHIAAELVGRYLKEREPWPAIALTVNTSALTAIGNDYGFDDVFARQVRAHGRAGDVLLAISTSGMSANVLTAIEAARHRSMRIVGLAGGSGGGMGGRCDVCVIVPSASTPRVQEAHILIAHIICGLVEDALA